MTLLTGSAMAASSGPVILQPFCPPLTSYSKEDQAKAAEELKKLSPGTVLPRYMTDYAKMREACRSIEFKFQGQ